MLQLRGLIFLVSLTLCWWAAGCATPPPSAAPKPGSGPAGANNSAREVNKRRAPSGNTGTAAWTMLDSRRMRVADHAGKVLVLDFWATYCPPCLAEAPHLDELQRRYGKQGLIIVGLNVGGPEDRPKIPDFVQQTKVQYDLAFPDGALVDSLMGSDDTIPQTFIFDRKGQLIKSFVGYTPQVAAELDTSIAEALNAAQ